MSWGPTFEEAQARNWSCAEEELLIHKGGDLYYHLCPPRMTCLTDELDNSTSCSCDGVDLPDNDKCFPECNCYSANSWVPFVVSIANNIIAWGSLYLAVWIVIRLRKLKELRQVGLLLAAFFF